VKTKVNGGNPETWLGRNGDVYARYYKIDILSKRERI
jgi:hypothetical protein